MFGSREWHLYRKGIRQGLFVRHSKRCLLMLDESSDTYSYHMMIAGSLLHSLSCMCLLCVKGRRAYISEQSSCCHFPTKINIIKLRHPKQTLHMILIPDRCFSVKA
jgi:hypothetical protein